MLSIRPGFSAQIVQAYLAQATHDADLVVNAASRPSFVDAFNAYNVWATKQVRTLGAALSPQDMAALVLTPRYWSLQTVNPGSYGDPLHGVIALEIAERVQALKDAQAELQYPVESWGSGKSAMVVLDTNVLLMHHAELDSFDWRGYLDVRSDVHIVVWIPIAAVEELDTLKLGRGEMTRGTKKLPVRNLARQALRDLNKIFEVPGVAPRFEDQTLIPARSFELRLLLDEPGRTRLPTVDSEIIDRAAGLFAYTSKVAVMTYDTGMIFSARTQGVEGVLLVEDVEDGEELGPFKAKPARA